MKLKLYKMTLYRIISSNLVFLLIIVAFSLLFVFQQQGGEAEQAYLSLQKYTEPVVIFWPLLFLISLTFCLFSFPGAGFTLSLGGYLLGLEYLPVASLILFLSTCLSFPFSRNAKSKSNWFRTFANSYVSGSATQSVWSLVFLRMNPATPFLFFAAFYDKKLNFKILSLLAVASVFHAFIYVLVGWNMRVMSLDFKSLSMFIIGFMVLTLIPVFLVSFFDFNKD